MHPLKENKLVLTLSWYFTIISWLVIWMFFPISFWTLLVWTVAIVELATIVVPILIVCSFLIEHILYEVPYADYLSQKPPVIWILIKYNKVKHFCIKNQAWFNIFFFIILSTPVLICLYYALFYIEVFEPSFVQKELIRLYPSDNVLTAYETYGNRLNNWGKKKNFLLLDDFKTKKNRKRVLHFKFPLGQNPSWLRASLAMYKLDDNDYTTKLGIPLPIQKEIQLIFKLMRDLTPGPSCASSYQLWFDLCWTRKKQAEMLPRTEGRDISILDLDRLLNLKRWVDYNPKYKRPLIEVNTLLQYVGPKPSSEFGASIKGYDHLCLGEFSNKQDETFYAINRFLAVRKRTDKSTSKGLRWLRCVFFIPTDLCAQRVDLRFKHYEIWERIVAPGMFRELRKHFLLRDITRYLSLFMPKAYLEPRTKKVMEPVFHKMSRELRVEEYCWRAALHNISQETIDFISNPAVYQRVRLYFRLLDLKYLPYYFNNNTRNLSKFKKLGYLDLRRPLGGFNIHHHITTTLWWKQRGPSRPKSFPRCPMIFAESDDDDVLLHSLNSWRPTQTKIRKKSLWDMQNPPVRRKNTRARTGRYVRGGRNLVRAGGRVVAGKKAYTRPTR